ncbi:MAG: ComEC/Rec2 family competence protein, partial [Chloroflexota bacterium]|nr:ComEC/Rec2 family competence protein [Chloroflexota bacterium]
ALLGAARYQATVPHPGPDDAGYYVGQQRVVLRGVVTEAPDVRDTATNLRLSVSALEVAGEWRPVGGLVQATVGRYPEYRYGDRLDMAGRLEEPPVFEDFSYKDYLARQGVLAVIYRPQVTLLARDQANPLVALLLSLRDRAQELITAALPEPQAALTVGVLLGVKSALPRDFSDDLQAVGLTHIVVVSGFNLAIVAGFLQRTAARRLGPNGSALVAVLGVLLFTLMVGASGAVVRSAIMVSLALVAVAVGRQNDALNSLALACGLMVAWWPPQLWDVGFQLSVAATFGLIWLSPAIEKWLERLPLAIRGNLAVALAAQAMTMPILVGNFHLVSLVSPVANLAVLWAVPFLMACGAVVALVAWIWAPAAAVVGWSAWLFATWIAEAVQRLANLPWAAAPVPRVDGAWWVAYYVLLWLAVRGRAPDPGTRQAAKGVRRGLAGRPRAALAALALAAVLTWAAVVTLPDRDVHVSFLDVGQGDAILIQTSRGQTILVDGGPSPSAVTTALGKRLPFWSRSLDLVVLTHPNDDHLVGLVEVLRRYQVAEVLEPGLPDRAATYAQWLKTIEEKGIRRRVAEAGQRVDLGDGAWLEVLGPPARTLAVANADANNSSVILRLVVGEVAFLLTGDVEAPGEQDLLRRQAGLTSVVLKVPHHGSRLSMDPEFMRAVNPAVAVISVGADNRFGHPSAEALDRLKGVAVYRTDRQGTIEVVTDGKTYEVKTER